MAGIVLTQTTADVPVGCDVTIEPPLTAKVGKIYEMGSLGRHWAMAVDAATAVAISSRTFSRAKSVKSPLLAQDGTPLYCPDLLEPLL